MSRLERFSSSWLSQDPRVGTLTRRAARLGSDFSGLGLVFCEGNDVIPHIPIYGDAVFERLPDPVSTIMAFSRKDEARHDGFHILDPNWRPICLGAFLSPPLPAGPVVNPHNRGSRWLAACLTSRDPRVLACLTIGQTDKSASLFVNGRVEYFAAPSQSLAIA